MSKSVGTKTWRVNDDHSRHPQLDGETVGLTDRFSNNLYYPGDVTSGPPEETQGCLCSLDVYMVEVPTLLDMLAELLGVEKAEVESWDLKHLPTVGEGGAIGLHFNHPHLVDGKMTGGPVSAFHGSSPVTLSESQGPSVVATTKKSPLPEWYDEFHKNVSALLEEYDKDPWKDWGGFNGQASEASYKVRSQITQARSLLKSVDRNQNENSAKKQMVVLLKNLGLGRGSGQAMTKSFFTERPEFQVLSPEKQAQLYQAVDLFNSLTVETYKAVRDFLGQENEDISKDQVEVKMKEYAPVLPVSFAVSVEGHVTDTRTAARLTANDVIRRVELVQEMDKNAEKLTQQINDAKDELGYDVTGQFGLKNFKKRYTIAWQEEDGSWTVRSMKGMDKDFVEWLAYRLPPNAEKVQEQFKTWAKFADWHTSIQRTKKIYAARMEALGYVIKWENVGKQTQGSPFLARNPDRSFKRIPGWTGFGEVVEGGFENRAQAEMVRDRFAKEEFARIEKFREETKDLKSEIEIQASAVRVEQGKKQVAEAGTVLLKAVGRPGDWTEEKGDPDGGNLLGQPNHEGIPWSMSQKEYYRFWGSWSKRHDFRGRRQSSKSAHSQEEAWRMYTSSGYNTYSHYLRDTVGKTGYSEPQWKTPKGREFMERRIKDMDALIASETLEHDIVVYRGVRGSFAQALQQGHMWSDKSYTSTTINPRISDSFGSGGVQMKIVLPAGTHVALGYDQEGEFILPRGSVFEVLGWDQEDNVWVVTVLPEGASYEASEETELISELSALIGDPKSTERDARIKEINEVLASRKQGPGQKSEVREFSEVWS